MDIPYVLKKTIIFVFNIDFMESRNIFRETNQGCGSMAVIITINGKENITTAENLSVLLDEMGLDIRGKVIARNGEILHRGVDLTTVPVTQGDSFDVFLITQGG
ncbi:hypothetical protein SDC9_192280 [bioreactor metagenome]|uniref:Sulfur carrier protein ThiS n=1 Tax=bioreactor metagenome TaxID=1076179 RepID=A0A645I0B8_9ZZZZ